MICSESEKTSKRKKQKRHKLPRIEVSNGIQGKVRNKTIVQILLITFCLLLREDYEGCYEDANKTKQNVFLHIA